MRLFNEVAAGEFASHQARMKSDRIDAAKARALQAMREARFANYNAAESEYYELGGMCDLESYVCNMVSVEIATGKIQ